MKQFWKYKRYSVGIALNVLISLAVSSLFALSFKYIIDEVTIGKNDSKLFILFFAMILGCIIYLASQIGGSYWLSKIAERMKDDLRLDMFEHLQKLPISYHNNVSKGSLTSRFTTDLASMQSSFLSLVPSVYAILSIGLTLGLTAWLHWGLAVISFLGIVLASVLPAYINRKAIGYNDNLKSEQTILNDYILEHLTIHKTIRAFNLIEWELNRLKRATLSIFPLAVKSHFTSQTSPISVSMALFFFNIVSVMVGAYLVTKDIMSVGMLVAYQSLYLTMSQQLKELSRHLPLLAATTASYSRIEQLLNEKPEKTVSSKDIKTVQLDKIVNDITLQDVSFAYTENYPILHEVNLTIEQNKYVAVVGRNGSGKSTIMNLLMRFYEPTRGKVEFDGMDARSISLDSLRNTISYVSQDTDLMNLSIFDNIKLGKLDAKKSRCMKRQ
ncbi:ABC transporter ATP-binding protein [Paenibacillus sp. N3.4]|uniref:ABC transporter ATP-binding protein n=1 Tax=Paenibacillus sp. N3.4 TaxID=2603222 RepID=UPI001C9D479E|nr:ABC transporter ATP-binding protein [Paenibacillus sp. N3.4]